MKFTTVRSDGEWMLKIRRSVVYGEDRKPDFRSEVEVKIVGAIHLATNAMMIAIVARITMRKNTMSADIGIAIPPTVNAIIIDCTSTIGEEGRIGDAAGLGIDLDHVRHGQTEDIIIVTITIGQTAQRHLPHPQAQSAMGAITRYRE